MHLREVAGPGRDRHVQALQRGARRSRAQDGVAASRQVDSANSKVRSVALSMGNPACVQAFPVHWRLDIRASAWDGSRKQPSTES